MNSVLIKIAPNNRYQHLSAAQRSFKLNNSTLKIPEVCKVADWHVKHTSQSVPSLPTFLQQQWTVPWTQTSWFHQITSGNAPSPIPAELPVEYPRLNKVNTRLFFFYCCFTVHLSVGLFVYQHQTENRYRWLLSSCLCSVCLLVMRL